MDYIKALKLCAAVAAVSFIAGCAMTPVAPPRGIMYTDQSAPLFPSSETGSVKGSASAYNILFMVGWGDCSIKTAASNAGITKIKSTDYELSNIFIFYQKFTVSVYGETAESAKLQQAVQPAAPAAR